MNKWPEFPQHSFKQRVISTASRPNLTARRKAMRPLGLRKAKRPLFMGIDPPARLRDTTSLEGTTNRSYPGPVWPISTGMRSGVEGGRRVGDRAAGVARKNRRPFLTLQQGSPGKALVQINYNSLETKLTRNQAEPRVLRWLFSAQKAIGIGHPHGCGIRRSAPMTPQRPHLDHAILLPVCGRPDSCFATLLVPFCSSA